MSVWLKRLIYDTIWRKDPAPIVENGDHHELDGIPIDERAPSDQSGESEDIQETESDKLEARSAMEYDPYASTTGARPHNPFTLPFEIRRMIWDYIFKDKGNQFVFCMCGTGGHPRRHILASDYHKYGENASLLLIDQCLDGQIAELYLSRITGTFCSRECLEKFEAMASHPLKSKLKAVVVLYRKLHVSPVDMWNQEEAIQAYDTEMHDYKWTVFKYVVQAHMIALTSPTKADARFRMTPAAITFKIYINWERTIQSDEYSDTDPV